MNLPEYCAHCKLPISEADRIKVRSSTSEMHFCCPGCRGAFAIITGAGLDAFYDKRKWEDPGIPEGAFDNVYSNEYLESFVTNPDNHNQEILFIVSGIRCAACIWLIESILGKQSGIKEATVNYGTHRGRVLFDPDHISLAQVFQAITRLGYAPKPFTQDAARSMQEQESRSMLIRFGTAAFLSMQLMGYSIALYGGYFSGMDQETKQLMQYFAALVATPVVFFSGAPFLQGAWRSILNRVPNMDLLIALGVLTAYIYSLGSMLTGGEVFFETAAMIITLILLGRIFENSARRKAYSAIDKLFQLAPDTACLIKEDATLIVTSDQLKAGDTILVGPGDRLPVDGILLDGETEVDESILTGEASPVLKRPNDLLLSGSLNVSTPVKIRVTRTAGTSYLARINRMIEEAQNRKAPVQGLADRVAGVFIPTVIFMALVTVLFWSLHSRDHITAIMNGIAVLVVACPCALGLATPTAILVATGTSASRGVLFRGGDTLEAVSGVTIAAFDKTGTLTDPYLQVVSVRPVDGSDQSLLELAARAESGSSHPLARGILAKAKEEGLQTANAGGVIIPGKGVKRNAEDETIVAGSRAFMAENHIAVPDSMQKTDLTEVHIACNGQYKGCIYLDSRLREGAGEMIKHISRLGLDTFLLTGDHVRSAKKIAGQAGIDHYSADLDPAAKTQWVQNRRDAGEVVLMVGDGVNDAPALSAASVGCAMSSGTDVALETSDLVLMHNDITSLPMAIIMARKTLSIIRQNLAWAFSYNLVAIPLAASGNLAPVYAAAAMAGSSLCVVANSLRLRTFRSDNGISLPRTDAQAVGEINA